MDPYEKTQLGLRHSLRLFAVLSGDIMGDSGDTWQDVRKRLVNQLRALADVVETADGPFLSFPSPREELDRVYQ